MASNYDNHLAEKRTFDDASLTASTIEDQLADKSISYKLNTVGQLQNTAKRSKMEDSGHGEKSPCKSNGALAKNSLIPGNKASMESGVLAECDEIDGKRLRAELANGSRDRRDEAERDLAVRLEKMRDAVRTLLECVGEDVNREGLLDTPLRYAKTLLFMTKGYQANVQDVVNNALFSEGHDGIVIVKDIEIFSLCEHHLVPFTGKMHIGYVPSGTVIGLSKLPRIAEIFCRRLQIQERLTREVAMAVMEVLSPQGVAVVMECTHMCMEMRGVEKTGARTLTSCLIGCFEQDSETRNKFFNLVGR